MITSALIVLDDESAHVRVFGFDWLDYVIRIVAGHGIGHVVVVVDRVPSSLGDILDRTRRRGVRCNVARSTVELADLFHPDETILLIGGTRLFEKDVLSVFEEAGTERLLCASDGAGQSFERIDAATWWTGLASVSGARVRAVSTAPGDWNAGSLLMRSAVQAGVTRAVTAAFGVVDASDRSAVMAFEGATLRSQARWIEGWGSLVIEPVARLIVRVVAPHIARAEVVTLTIAATLSLIAILVAVASFDRRVAIAAGCIVLAKVAVAVAYAAATAIGASGRTNAVLRNVVDAAAGAALIASAAPAGQGATLLVLAVLVAGLTWLCRRGVTALASPPRWWPDVAGQALLLAAATCMTPTLVAPALIVAALHASAGLVWLQDRVSELLRSRC